MNDLDKRIAELKGWIYDPARVGWIFRASNLGVECFVDVEKWSWSTSDAKALELVDELIGDSPDRMAAFRFALVFRGKAWVARFEPYWLGGDRAHSQAGHCFEDRAATRPEAICRAYIAAMEWMAKKS